MNNFRLIKQIAGITAVLGMSIVPATMQAQDTQSSPAPDQSQSAPAQKPAQKGGALADLNLTDDQKAQIQQIHKDTKAKVEAVNGDSTLTADEKLAKAKALRMAAHRQVAKVLTPEQRQAMRERARARRAAAAPQPS